MRGWVLMGDGWMGRMETGVAEGWLWRCLLGDSGGEGLGLSWILLGSKDG